MLFTLEVLEFFEANVLVEDGKREMKYIRFFLVNLTWFVQPRKADLT